MYIEVRATSPGQGTYYLRYKDATGKTCHQKIGRTTILSLAEARKQAKTVKATITLGADPRGEQKAKQAVPTLDALYADYEAYAKPRKRSWKKDEGLYRLHIKETFGAKRLNELRRQEILTFHAELLVKGLAPATADHVVKLIRQMLNKAVEWEMISVSPIARIKLFNPDNRLENYLDNEELERLLTVLRTDDNRTVCRVALFLLSTGARVNEALKATWDHIDRDTRVWRIPALNSKSKKIRSVPLNDSALEVLDELEAAAKSEFLFVSPKTKEHLTNIHKVWERLRNKAKLPQLRLHDLRHMYASFLVNDGRTLYEVQKILGHSSHSVTERYAHLSSASLRDAANSASLRILSAMSRAAQEGAQGR